MLNIGVYGIECLVNNKIYVGSTNNFRRRRGRHFSELKCGKHENLYLQRAYNKYGLSNFRFRILHLCSEDILIEKEQGWIDKFGRNVFNMQPAGKPPVNSGEKHWMFGKGYLQVGPLNARWGKKHTEEWKQEVSLRRKGVKHTEQAKKNMAFNRKRNRKLTNKQVVEIKNHIREGQLSSYRLAKMYNVSQTTIGMIKSGKTHRYIGQENWSCCKL